MPSLKRCHEILDLKPGSSFDEARQAYREMVAVWHPDKYLHNERLLEKANLKIREINEAWDQLQAYYNKNEELIARDRMQKERDDADREQPDRRRRENGGKKRAETFIFDDLELDPLISVEVARQAYRDRVNLRYSAGPEPKRSGSAMASLQYEPEGAGSSPPKEESVSPHERPTTAPPKSERIEKGPKLHDVPPKTAQPQAGHAAAGPDLKTLSDNTLKSLTEKGSRRKVELGRFENKWRSVINREKPEPREEYPDASEFEAELEPAERKELLKKNKALSDLYLTQYNFWIANQKALFRNAGKIPLGAQAAPSNEHEPTEKFLLGIPNIKMKYIKGNPFLMGEDDPENLFVKFLGNNNSHPRHKVVVSDFYIGTYLVTERQWCKGLGLELRESGQEFPALVLWEEIQAFLDRINEASGLNFRMLTEAEWEYAARCGGSDEKWPGNADPATLPEIVPIDFGDIGRCRPNRFGIYDMLGNTGEWVADWFDRNYYRYSPEDNPRGPDTGDSKVIRGSIFKDSTGKDILSDNFRRNPSPLKKSQRAGFRLAHPADF